MSESGAGGEVTQLLRAHREGDRESFDRAVDLVYDELRGVAQRQLRGERRRDTMDTAALVHDAYARLVGERSIEFSDRQHFYAIAARTMRRILVDNARKRKAGKRGGGRPDLTLEPERVSLEEDVDLVLAVHGALERLSEIDERLVRVVEHRFFAGLSAKETAETMGMSLRSVERCWTRARAWLLDDLG